MAAELTASSRDDASTLPDLLAPLEVPIRRFTAGGAYDHRSVYDRTSAAGTENVVIVIPPRRSALSAGPTDGPWAQREASLQRIRKVGRREWQMFVREARQSASILMLPIITTSSVLKLKLVAGSPPVT